MSTCTRCNLCQSPGTMSASAEISRVPCNVRRFKDELFTLWRCSGCGSIHCAEDADLPVYYEHYPLKEQKLTFHERVGYARRLRLLEGQGFRRSGKILDYGCGAGLFVNFLRDKHLPHVFGYDAFVPACADRAILQDTYDAVVSYDVIEHDDDPRAFMQSLSRLVRPGGLLVIGTPRAEGVSIQRLRDPSLHPPYHRHILSEKALLSLGREQKMEPIHVYRRSFYDSLCPTVNSRFSWRYLEKCGYLDAVTEPPRIGLIGRSPELLFLALFGYFVPRGDYAIATFRKI